MKDKRLDALLATLPYEIPCAYFIPHGTDALPPICTMPSAMFYNSKAEEQHPFTGCQGDIRKCEREE